MKKGVNYIIKIAIVDWTCGLNWRLD